MYVEEELAKLDINFIRARARQRRVIVAHSCISVVEPVTPFLWKAMNVVLSVSLRTVFSFLDSKIFPQFSFGRQLLFSPQQITVPLF